MRIREEICVFVVAIAAAAAAAADRFGSSGSSGTKREYGRLRCVQHYWGCCVFLSRIVLKAQASSPVWMYWGRRWVRVVQREA